MSAAISIRDLTFRYRQLSVLEHINLDVVDGEFLGVVGPNGGGKTTLLKLIMGLLRPAGGEIRILGQQPDVSRSSVGYVPQFARFRRDFPISAEQVVMQGRLGCGHLLGRFSKHDRLLCKRAMIEAGIPGLARRSIDQLSGGEVQRVLIARALVGDPRILLLDEPTSNIDQRGEQDIFDLLAELNKRMTVIVVSHDIAFISSYVERIACLNRTLVCHRASSISGDDIQAMYGSDVEMIHHHHDHQAG